jgi:rhodanese-related sulfurtransferase
MIRTLTFAIAAALGALGATAAVHAQTAAPAAGAPAARPTMPQVCTNCHKPAPGEVSGYFDSVAFKSSQISLKIDAITEIVKFDTKAIKVVDADEDKKPEHLREIKRGHEALVRYVEKDGQKVATEIRFKGPIKTPPAKLVNFETVAKLVEQGPEKGNYTLFDSRPLARFQQGTIPTAINLPYPAFEKFADRLPADKERLVVFFCQGVTCMMSPMSLRKTEARGYKNVKVYREGIPEWQTKRPAVLPPNFLNEAFLAKDIPAVVIDVRSAEDANAGHIKGAVSIPLSNVKAALKQMPDKKFAAPIFVYDGKGGAEAAKAAQMIVDAGQTNVLLMTGGLIAWQAAGFPIETGPTTTKIAYAPKPRQGSVAAAEFQKLATNTPPDVLILDVRNQDEANAGMIKGAKLVPDEKIATRLAEIPKDKRIVTHCATGIRAEMAYHKLKEAGYKDVGFLYGDIEIAKDGKFKITQRY